MATQVAFQARAFGHAVDDTGDVLPRDATILQCAAVKRERAEERTVDDAGGRDPLAQGADEAQAADGIRAHRGFRARTDLVVLRSSNKRDHAPFMETEILRNVECSDLRTAKRAGEADKKNGTVAFGLLGVAADLEQRPLS